jgi:hypothetical protein
MGLGFVNWRCLRTSHATLAEDGRGRRERRAGADAALAFEHHAGHLPAVRARVAAESGRKTQQPIKACAVIGRNWTHNGPKMREGDDGK